MAVGEPQVIGAAVYPFRAASTRLRLGLLSAPLEHRGVGFKVWTYLEDRELDSWVSGSRLTPAALGLARTPALLEAFRSGSALVVQRECLPWNSLVMENAAMRRVPVIWDVDDAMWHSSRGMRGWVRGGQSKYARLARIATEVWAGSETVASWCEAQGARKVRLVPTVTPIPDSVAEPDNPPRLVWVGTPSTVRYLNQMLLANHQILREWVIEVVGAKPLPFPDLQIEAYPWTQENENRALSRAWAGLYPIDTTHEFSTGKSALKAVLMGAYGLPVIATWTMSNAAVIEQGRTGFLIQDNRDWEEYLALMLERGLRDRMGLAARSRVEAEFNPAIWGQRLANAVLELVK